METHYNPRIGGMLLGYFHLCPRKAWLSHAGIWLEHTSDRVAQGRALDETAYARARKAIPLEAELDDGTQLVGKVDWAELRNGVLHETKLSRACEEAHLWQVRFYLWLLHLNGVSRADGSPFVGELNYPRLRRTERVELQAQHVAELETSCTELAQLLRQPTPPPRIDKRKFCAKCAFEELCYG